MRHNVAGTKLGRTSNERRALFKILMSEVVEHGHIKTTLAKAKAVKPSLEKLVTKAKKGSLADKSEVRSKLTIDAAAKLLADAKVQFANRASGYTRIIKLGFRNGDNAPLALLEWVDAAPVSVKKVAKKKTETKEATVKAEKPAAKKTVKKATTKKAAKKA
jgi:large subunit ribosomal protein L17